MKKESVVMFCLPLPNRAGLIDQVLQDLLAQLPVSNLTIVSSEDAAKTLSVAARAAILSEQERETTKRQRKDGA